MTICFICLSPLRSFSAETELQNTTWIYDFFSKGIQSVFAEYSIEAERPQNASPNYYQQLNFSVRYDAESKLYEFRFIHEYREDWSVLTRSGANQPPKQYPHFTGSKIQPWSNSSGTGIYSEKYERTVPNWLVFDDLDSMILLQFKLGNPLPSLTGIFYSDELKALKKLYKSTSDNFKDDPICGGFEFDKAGNVVELSRNYLTTFSTKKTAAIKKLQDYTLSIRNKEDNVVFIEILTTGSKYPMLEGLSFKSGEKKCTLFSFEINSLIHKFAPELIADPQRLVNDYIVALQTYFSKPFKRFNTIEGK